MEALTLVTLIIDLVALVFMATGALMLSRAWRSRRRQDALALSDDPARYALAIFGMILLAFGLIIFGFFTVFALARG